MNRRLTCLADLIDEEQFLQLFGGIYEKSPWIVQQLWHKTEGHPPADLDVFAMALAEIVDTSSAEQKLDLIRAHPDLAGRAALAGELTDESKSEQSSAGLDQCTPAELEQFQEFNNRYKSKFGFPFIMAVRGANRHQILNGFAERIDNDRATETARAIAEIHRIAMLRLTEIAINS